MARSRILVSIGLLILVSLALSFVPPLRTTETAVAQASEAGAIEPLELKYDNGDPIRTMEGQGCEACTLFQGVRYNLPTGMPSATLSSVRMYVNGGSVGAAHWLYITDKDHKTELVDPIPCSLSLLGWNEVTLPDVVVPPEFWIILKRTSVKNMLFYDPAKQDVLWSPLNRSFQGESLDKFNEELPGDLLMRAYLKAEVHVGVGQTFARIQTAIDAVGAGTRIIVHEGTYSENVTVNKSVYIASLSGPAKTIVQTPSVDRNTFTITAPDVTLSGFTIQGSTGDDCAGVLLQGAKGCLIKGNTVLDNNYGICLGAGAMGNILLQNECKYNVEGLHVDGSQNYISGNKIHGNTALIGSAVLVTDNASGNVLRYNSITVDEEMAAVEAIGPQVCTTSGTREVDAVENWWGTDTGPVSTANAGGGGPSVGDRVLFDPWLKKPPVYVKTVAAASGDYTLSLVSEASTAVVKKGEAMPVISVASFAENPAGEFKGQPLGKWIDVLFSSTVGVTQAEVRIYYTADEVAGLKPKSLRLYWWNGEKWTACSNSGVDEANGFVWGRVNVTSKPGLTDLSGTFFTAGFAKGGGGFSWWTIPMAILVILVLLVAFRLFWVLTVKRVPV